MAREPLQRVPHPESGAADIGTPGYGGQCRRLAVRCMRLAGWSCRHQTHAFPHLGKCRRSPGARFHQTHWETRGRWCCTQQAA
eukprot:4629307-Prymnesium_polylepis.2